MINKKELINAITIYIQAYLKLIQENINKCSHKNRKLKILFYGSKINTQTFKKMDRITPKNLSKNKH
jgi:hypothetical protein